MLSFFLLRSRASTESDTTNTVDDANISSLLSPTALGVTPSAITPQQLRHVHPKKRHRLISHDQYEPFAKVCFKVLVWLVFSSKSLVVKCRYHWSQLGLSGFRCFSFA